MKTKKGFTLVELLVVISIIAILLAVLIPSMNKAKETAKRVICSNGKKQIALGTAAYAPEYNGLLPWGGGIDPLYPADNIHNKLNKDNNPEDKERHPYITHRWISSAPRADDYTDDDGKPIPMRHGCLYARGIIKDARVFYCPSVPSNAKSYQYDSYIEPLPPDNTSREWGTLPQKSNEGENQWVRTGVCWFPIDLTVKRIKDDTQAPLWTARKFDNLESKIPFFSDRIWNATSTDPVKTLKGMEDITHRQGNQYGINAGFKDGHIVYVKGPKTFGDKGPFDDEVWQKFGTTGGSDPTAYLRFFYIIYSAIQP